MFFRCLQWIEFSGNAEVSIAKANKYRMCSKHFEDESYANPSKRFRLKKDALPTKKGVSKQ